jgi:hypothetical protein
MPVTPLIVLGLLTAGCVWARTLRWLRVTTVVGCMFFALFFGHGLVHAARAAVIDDVSLLRSTVRYGDAYRAGSDATQRIVNRNVRSLALLYTYLMILALVPLRTKAPAQGRDPEGTSSTTN